MPFKAKGSNFRRFGFFATRGEYVLRGGDSCSKVGWRFADNVDVGWSVRTNEKFRGIRGSILCCGGDRLHALPIGMVEQMAEAKERVILVVDDNADHRKAFRIVLESGGYFVTESNSGKEALTALETISVDLMTLDLSMPDVDGFDVLQAARSKHPALKIVVVVSGFLQGNMNQAAKKLGAAVTLDKNMASELLPIVRDLLDNNTTEPIQ
jgi:CheY-like chemotaxis protein